MSERVFWFKFNLEQCVCTAVSECSHSISVLCCCAHVLALCCEPVTDVISPPLGTLRYYIRVDIIIIIIFYYYFQSIISRLTANAGDY